jgi:hypothetical protein
MRLIALIVALALAPGTARAGTAEELLDSYATKAGYRAVKREVLRWHKTTRNGCVAFASTALRRIGVDVPLDAEMDGEKVSRLTLPFVKWLERELGWTRITDPAALRPGDLVFTENAEYPWYVFVFHSWKNERKKVARVIDNLGLLKPRAILGDEARDWTPMAYALRAPD